MRTKVDAVRALLAAGWTEAEINIVFGDTPKSLSDSKFQPDAPWWSLVADGEYEVGSTFVPGWEQWVSGQQ